MSVVQCSFCATPAAEQLRPGETVNNRFCDKCLRMFTVSLPQDNVVGDDLELQEHEENSDAYMNKRTRLGRDKRHEVKQSIRKQGSVRGVAPARTSNRAQPISNRVQPVSNRVRPASGRAQPPAVVETEHVEVAAIAEPEVPAVVESIEETSSEPPAVVDTLDLSGSEASAGDATAEIPVAMPNAKGSTKLNVQPAAVRPSQARLMAPAKRASARASGRVGRMSGYGHQPVKEKPFNWLPLAIGGGAVVVVLIGYMMMGKGTPPPETSKKPVTPENIVPVVPTPGPTQTFLPTTPAALPPAKVEAPKAKPKEDTPADLEAVGGVGQPPAKPDTEAKPDAETPAPVVEPKKPVPSDVDIAKQPSKPAASADDDEEGGVTTRGTGMKKAEPKGDPKDPKANSITGVLGVKKEDPAAVVTPVGPPQPPKLGESSATEPSVVALDFEKLQGAEKDWARSIGNAAMNWKAKDFVTETTVLGGTTHRGRDKAICLNPCNDVLTAKLYATIDVPAKFNPVLRFEVASKSPKDTWYVKATVLGMDLLPRTMVRTPDPLGWMDVSVPLTNLRGKKFDLSIECIGSVKQSNKFREQLCYIRNVRLEWSGKPAAK